MTIRQALQLGTAALRAAAIPTPQLDAEVLLCHARHCTREFLFTYPEKSLTTRQERAYRALIQKRRRHQPIAYLIGKKEFYGREFAVDKRVLIPRPETELLVETVVSASKELSRPTIADIGTGNGCIAVTLKKVLPNANIIATDASRPALAVAKTNARKHQAKITFAHGDLLTPLKKAPVDILVSNLPYLPKGKKSRRPDADVWYEPAAALFGGADGLACFRKLFAQVAARSAPPQVIALEIGHDQAQALKTLTKKLLPHYTVEIKKDLAKKNRIAVLQHHPNTPSRAGGLGARR